jgi:hypothetical protein
MLKKVYSLRKVLNAASKVHTGSGYKAKTIENGSAYLEIFDTQESEIIQKAKDLNRRNFPHDLTSNVVVRYSNGSASCSSFSNSSKSGG